MLCNLFLTRGRRLAALTLAVGVGLAIFGAQAARATLPGPVTVHGEGFDSAALPSASDFANWWVTTPYSQYGFYLGGENSAGTNPGHDWLAAVMTDGYGVDPIWVGPQAPCVNQGGLATMSSNANTAQEQGVSQADQAIAADKADGFANSYITYDMEAFDSSNAGCLTAVQSFVNGWAYEIQRNKFSAGLYGSSCGSDIAQMGQHSNVPNIVWVADWGFSDKATSPIQCLPNNSWDHNQRIHQWSGGTATRFNPGDSGPSISLDEDCFAAFANRTSTFLGACH